MNPQVQLALSKFSALLEGRNSFVSEVDCKKALDGDGVVGKLQTMRQRT